MRNIFLALGKHGLAALVFIAAISTSGCALFVSHYDAAAYQYFTSLKAYHLKFIDDFSAPKNDSFKKESAMAACDAGYLKFREAEEYSIGKNDQSRVRAFKYLNDVFIDNCGLLVKQGNFYSGIYKQEITPEITKNYDLAIRGEFNRVGNNTGK